MREYWKNWKLDNWIVAFFIFLAGLWMLFSVTVSLRAVVEREQNNRYFLEQEQLLIGEVRGFLAAKGFQNSGVTLRRMSFGDGDTEYRLIIHHRGINELREEQREELKRELEEFQFDSETGVLVQEFLK